MVPNWSTAKKTKKQQQKNLLVNYVAILAPPAQRHFRDDSANWAVRHFGGRLPNAAWAESLVRKDFLKHY